jgi:hypothetical protein
MGEMPLFLLYMLPETIPGIFVRNGDGLQSGGYAIWMSRSM